MNLFEKLFIFSVYFGHPTGQVVGPFCVPNRIYRRNETNKLIERLYAKCRELVK